jgi:hypothetical protein
MNRRYFNIITNRILCFFFLAILFSNCTKELNEVTISTQTNSSISTKENALTHIDYQISGKNIDSICLFVDGMLHQSHTEAKNEFGFRITEKGEHSALLRVYYMGGAFKSTESIRIYCNPYTLPRLDFNITNINDQEDYFVGEKLLIEPYSNSDFFDFNDCKQVSLFLNGDSLSTGFEAPFIFETGVLTNKHYTLRVDYIDKDDTYVSLEKEIEIPINPQTELEFKFMYNWENHGNYFNDKAVEFRINAHENTSIDRLEIFIEEVLVHTIPVNQSYFFGSLVLDTLSPGTHHIFCRVHDDRNHQLDSEILTVHMHKSIQLSFEDRIIEFLNTSNENLIYGLSAHQLYLINPIEETIDQMIELEYQNANCMTYKESSDQLYIGFENGQIQRFDHLTMTFENINTDLFTNVKDVAVDLNQEVLFLLENAKLFAYQLNTQDTVSSSIEFSDNASLAFHHAGNTIIVGGNEESSGNKFYKLQYENNTFNELKSKRFGNYTKEIYPNQKSNELLLRSGRHSGSIWGIENFGEHLYYLDLSYPESVAYSYDFSQIALGIDSYRELYIYNASSYAEIHKLKVPIDTYESIHVMCSSHDSDKWMLSIIKGMQSQAKLVFLRTELD